MVPVVEPGADPAEVIAAPPPEALAAAARALQVEAARWARLRVGEELVYEWRFAHPGAVRALRAVPRQRDERPAGAAAPPLTRRGRPVTLSRPVIGNVSVHG